MDDPKRMACMQDAFSVESNDEDEIIKMIKIHAKEKHETDLSDEEIKNQIRESLP